MSVLALVPARGGSKGVPRKNVRLLGGRPLIAWSIAAGLNAARVDHVAVSTDDDEIADVAAACGVEVIRRPAALADDGAPMLPVVRHAVETLAAAGRRFETLTLLQPTCPFRTAADIDGSVDRLARGDVDGVIGVYRVYDDHPARMYRVTDDRLTPLDAAYDGVNRQDLPAVYKRNGAIYTLSLAATARENSLFVRNCAPFEMPRERSVNIDEPLDFIVAEAVAAGMGAL